MVLSVEGMDVNEIDLAEPAVSVWWFVAAMVVLTATFAFFADASWWVRAPLFAAVFALLGVGAVPVARVLAFRTQRRTEQDEA